MSFWAPSIDRGALRSLRNRNRLYWPFSRISCRIRRSSSPCSPYARGAVLGPANVHRRGLKIELLDRETYQLGDPQGMAERQNDEELVPGWVAVPASSLP
jgi:hypothetical protein